MVRAGWRDEAASSVLAARIGLALLLAAVPVSHAIHAAPGTDAGEALYRLGMRLIEEGRPEQGLERLEEVARVAPDSPWADDALLAAARHYYPPLDVSQLGSASEGAIDRALQLLGSLRERYPLADSVPAATYTLGLIAMDPANPRRSLDEAYAHFASVMELHPDSPEAAPSAFAAARCSFSQGIVNDAAALLLWILEERPASPLADRARFMLSDLFDRGGESTRALHELQILRDTSPSSPLDAEASRRATLLYRVRKLASGEFGSARPAWRRDDTYAPRPAAEELRSPVALAVSPDGSLHAADEKADSVLTIGPAGDVSGGTPWDRPQDIALGPNGEVLVAGSRAVGWLGKAAVTPAAGPESGDRDPGRVRRIGGIAVSPDGRVLLIDASTPSVLAYDRNLVFQSVVYRAESGEISGIATGPDGEVWIGLAKPGEILRLDARGRETARISGATAGVASMSDLAVDEIGDLYVLDDRTRSVLVFDRNARPVTVIGLDGLGLGGVTLTAIAVDGAGRIYFADRRTPRLWRLE